MFRSAQNSMQLPTVFGGEFVQEQHEDETHRHLLPKEPREFAIDFYAIIKRLRAALSLRVPA